MPTQSDMKTFASDMDQETMQGEYVTLIPLATEHCLALSEAVQDGELWRLWFATVPAPEAMSNEISRRLDLKSKGLMIPYTVVNNKTKKPIGMTTYCNIDLAHKRVEIGWTWYKKSMQRTAVNTECKLLLLTYAFEHLQCNVVEFRANYHNHASRKAIERLGAKFDGILRNHRVLKNGILSDDCAYSIINNEWPSVKANLQWKLRAHAVSSEPLPVSEAVSQ